MEQRFNFTYAVKRLELALRPRFNAACASAGMTPAQYTAMTVLRSLPGLPSSELARRSFVRAQTMAMTLDPLLEAGYIRREQDPNHARRMLLHLTDAGADVLRRAEPEFNAFEDLIVSELTPEEQETFARLLRRVRKTIDAHGHRP